MNGLSQRDPNLDLVRTVAITTVLLSHSASVLPEQAALGHGVDIFFCLSGFLIGRIFLKEESRGFSFKRFWADRWLRTIPTYFFVLLAGLGLGQTFGRPWSLGHFEGHLWQYAAFVQNYGFVSSLTPQAPFVVSWSLCVEEQFYLTLPVIFVLVRSFYARVLLLAAVVCIANLTRTFASSDWSYASHYRFDGIAWGVMASIVASRFPSVPRTLRRFQNPLVVVWLVLLFWRCFGWTPRVDYITVLNLVTTTLILGSAGNVPIPGARNAFNRWTAGISYSLYLVHASVYEILLASWDILPLAGQLPSAARWPVIWVVTYLAALALYAVAEKPSYAVRALVRARLHRGLAAVPTIPSSGQPGFSLPLFRNWLMSRRVAIGATALLTALSAGLSFGLGHEIKLAMMKRAHAATPQSKPCSGSVSLLDVESEGFGPLEGPFPSLGFRRRVRWMHRRDSVLRVPVIALDLDQRVLRLRVLSYASGQYLQVNVNGQPVLSARFGVTGIWQELASRPFRLQSQMNTLEFQASTSASDGKRELVVLFDELALCER